MNLYVPKVWFDRYYPDYINFLRGDFNDLYTELHRYVFLNSPPKEYSEDIPSDPFTQYAHNYGYTTANPHIVTMKDVRHLCVKYTDDEVSGYIVSTLIETLQAFLSTNLAETKSWGCIDIDDNDPNVPASQYVEVDVYTYKMMDLYDELKTLNDGCPEFACNRMHDALVELNLDFPIYNDWLDLMDEELEQ